MITWPLTVNNQNDIQYTVRTEKMYTYNQLNHHFNWREIKIIVRIDWGILLGTLRTYYAKPRGITFIKATQIRRLSRSSGREGWSLLKFSQTSSRDHHAQVTQIRLFSWWPGGRLVRLSGGQIKGYILWGCWKTTGGSHETKPENR